MKKDPNLIQRSISRKEGPQAAEEIKKLIEHYLSSGTQSKVQHQPWTDHEKEKFI